MISVTSIKNGLEYEGVSGYVDVGDSDLNLTTAISISFWGKIVDGQVIENGYNSASDKGLLFYVSGNKLLFVLGDGSSKAICETNDTLDSDTWAHYVGTWDGSTMKLYVDGTLQDDTESFSGPIVYLDPNFFIGRDTAFFEGSLSDVRVWNTGLTQNDVNDLYDGKFNVKTDNIVAWYPMSDGMGDYCVDISDNSNHGELKGNTKPRWIIKRDRLGINFDGNNDYVDVNNLGNSPSITLSAWVKFNGLAGDYQFVLDYYWADVAYLGVNEVDGELCSRAGIKHEGGTQFLSGDNIYDGEWHHLVVTFDNETDTATLYTDGEVDDSEYIEGASLPSSTEKVNVGGKSQSGYNVNGTIDDVRIFDRALSAKEIARLYLGLDVSDDGLVLHHDYSKGHTRDLTKNHNDGTMTNFTAPYGFDRRILEVDV